MSDDTFFLDTQHASSLRFGVFEDDGTSAWLYLTDCNSRKPIADIWIHNRIAPPLPSEIENFRGGPPPAAVGYAGDGALCESPRDCEWEFAWSPDGNAVALIRDQQPVAFATAGSKQGFSRNLNRDGPWGNVWDDALFHRLFNATA